MTAFGENYAMKSLSAAESTVRPSLPRRPPNCSPPMFTSSSVCPLMCPTTTGDLLHGAAVGYGVRRRGLARARRPQHLRGRRPHPRRMRLVVRRPHAVLRRPRHRPSGTAPMPSSSILHAPQPAPFNLVPHHTHAHTPTTPSHVEHAHRVQVGVAAGVDRLGQQVGSNWTDLLEKLQNAGDTVPPEL